MNEQIYTVNEVASYLKISCSELRKLMYKGEIHFFEIGEIESKKKSKRFKESDILEYIEKNYNKRKENN